MEVTYKDINIAISTQDKPALYKKVNEKIYYWTQALAKAQEVLDAKISENEKASLL